MTNVTLVSSPMDGSCGIGTYARSLLSGFEDEVEVNVVTLNTHAEGLRAIPSYVLAAFRAGRSTDDVVHVQHEYGLFGTKWYLLWVFYPLLFVFTRLHGTPVLITVHEAWNADRVDPPLERVKAAYIWLANRLIAGTATSMIFLSANCEQKFTRSVPVENSHTITHGVDDQTIDVPKSQAKEHFGFDPDDTVITEPGYVRPSKGYETFLEIADQMPDYEFLVAGGSRGADDYFESIVESAPENVTVTGHLEDEEFHLAFRATDIAVLPYNEVAQSGIFNTCVAYRLPTVTSNRPYFERLSTEYDCLLTFESVAGAADQITIVLEEPATRRQLSRGLQRFEDENHFDSIREKHISLYNSLGKRLDSPRAR